MLVYFGHTMVICFWLFNGIIWNIIDHVDVICQSTMVGLHFCTGYGMAKKGNAKFHWLGLHQVLLCITYVGISYAYYFKVKSAKSTINTTPPKTYDHLLVKFKKRQVGQLNYIVSWPPDADISVDNYKRKILKK